jgi:hypothetical protein
VGIVTDSMDKIISNYHTTALTDTQGQIQDFKLGGRVHLKNLRRAEGGTNIFGVFCVKNHIFPILGGGRGCQVCTPLDTPHARLYDKYDDSNFLIVNFQG